MVLLTCLPSSSFTRPPPELRVEEAGGVTSACKIAGSLKVNVTDPEASVTPVWVCIERLALEGGGYIFTVAAKTGALVMPSITFITTSQSLFFLQEEEKTNTKATKNAKEDKNL